jgi:hypothetical protein
MIDEWQESVVRALIRPLISKGSKLVSILSLLAFVCVASASSQTIEKQALTHLENIRAIRADADEKTVAGYNKSMDEAWKFFTANKASVLPILRREITFELRRPTPNDLLLLDIGYYLRLQPDSPDKDLGKAALFKLNPASEIVYLNQQQLFNFTYAVATDEDPRVLPFIDRAFLRQKMSAYVAPHSLTLNETLVCVFLYGVHGQGSEAHLRSLLPDKAVTRKVLEILIWIGTPDSVQAVREAMLADRNYETFGRATAFMMKAGGREGRAAMLALNPKDFDLQSQEYLGRVRPLIEATSYETFRTRFASAGDSARLSDDALKKRLADIHENNGKYDKTDLIAILDSTLPRTFLINELLRIRARTFRRLSDEGLTDVLATNSILNALYYREK